MKNIDVLVQNSKVGQLFFENESNIYGFNYTNDASPISLTMPYKPSSYKWKNRLHPIFDMNMPEGYLFEIFKNFLNKEHQRVDDFLIFSYLAPNIQSRLTFKSWFEEEKFDSIDLDEILQNDSEESFLSILKHFLHRSAISGIQPKTLALLNDKNSLSTKEYIIKTWGSEYPDLALNEYFCLKAIEKANVPIPNIMLSKNKNFLVVERFNYDKKKDEFLGFEEILVLLGKNKDEKYDGSYEQIAKIVYSVTTDKTTSMKNLYKTIVMNYLLKNGDAHLKNFGILYDNEFENVEFAPAYDVVNTVVYMFKDRPALSMFGKRVWSDKNTLLKFATLHCYMSTREAQAYYSECLNALEEIIYDLEKYISENIDFKKIGHRVLDVWKFSLKDLKVKELPSEIIRNWN